MFVGNNFLCIYIYTLITHENIVRVFFFIFQLILLPLRDLLESFILSYLLLTVPMILNELSSKLVISFSQFKNIIF